MTEKQKSAKDRRTLWMEIDHREVSFPEGVNVLRAAELNGIYIPSLCSHKDLSPFGGCRMCVVEIEGMRGYPLACSTEAVQGMKVLTDTARLRDMRREVLQLILSEHPSSCLVCDEKGECVEFQHTIRKTGVTTGCRYCPNDQQCELQTVVEKIGLEAIDYPIYYRGYEAEHDDPFFDRDYNICILCGRCVRMCQELRGAAVLAFNHRGPNVKIGPAYGKSHIEAGCEFCGACVSVCPTGALADKVSKWDGKPDGIKVSTCPFCAIGCRVELHHKQEKLSKVFPNLDEEINDGQLCVRGRFSLPETTHHHERARKPMLKRGDYFREVSWEEALEEVAGKLKGLKGDDFLMLVSGDLTNESIYSAQKFVRSVLGNNSIDSTARRNLPGGLGLWTKLFSLPISMKGIVEADTILTVGIDSRFYYSVVGVQVRHALRNGARLVTIDARDSNISRHTDHWLRPLPGLEAPLLNAVAKGLSGKRVGLNAAANHAGVDKDLLKDSVEVLKNAGKMAVIIGPTIFEYSDNAPLIEAVSHLAARPDTIFMPLHNGSNVRGALELGAFGELLPGLVPSEDRGLRLDDLQEKRKKKPKVLYLVGQTPFRQRPDCDFLICQDIYYPPFAVDAFLPAAGFAEAGGTLTNIEGRVQELVKIEDLPDGAVTGFVRPDWRIFSDLAVKLDSQALRYKDENAILKEIHKAVPDFPATPDRRPRQLKAHVELPIEKSKSGTSGKGGFLLVVQPAGFQHRGVDLSHVVEGLGELGLERGLRLNPDDMAELGIETGDMVSVSFNGNKISVTAKADEGSQAGVVYLRRPINFGGLADAIDPDFFSALRSNPARVQVKPQNS